MKFTTGFWTAHKPSGRAGGVMLVCSAAWSRPHSGRTPGTIPLPPPLFKDVLESRHPLIGHYGHKMPYPPSSKNSDFAGRGQKSHMGVSDWKNLGPHRFS